MDPNLKSYLEKHNIQYKNYEHPAVFTVEESKKIKINIPSLHTKCLFLKDENSQFYLVAIPAEKRLNILLLRKKFNLKINNATIVLDHSNLEKFYNSLNSRKEIVSL